MEISNEEDTQSHQTDDLHQTLTRTTWREQHSRLPPIERRARSWPFAALFASALFEMTRDLRSRLSLARDGVEKNKYTQERPFVYWILEADERVEGVLVESGHFAFIAGVPARHTECYIMGHDLEAGEKDEYKDGVRVRLQKIRYDDTDAVSSIRKPDLIMIYCAEFTSSPGEGRNHITLPTHVLDAGRGAGVAVSLRFKLCQGSIKTLGTTLGSQLAFPPIRNSFSALAGDEGAEYDDNGWVVGMKSVDALIRFQQIELQPHVPEARGPDDKLTALFWGIVDLKYNPMVSIFERVKVLETGDGRNSKFSHHGADIPKWFRSRYCLAKNSNGRHTVVSNNKKLTHDEFVDNGYEHLVPQQLCLPRVYDFSLAQRIIHGLGCSRIDIVILKLCNRSRAAGIIPVSVCELDKMLKELLEVPDDMEAWLDQRMAEGSRQPLCVQWGSFEEQYRHWWSNECPFFVVERCCKSLPMPSDEDDHRYDGTLRVAFALRRKDSQKADPKTRRAHTTDIHLNDESPSPEQIAANELVIEWLGGYWKLPKESLDSPHLRDRIISAAKSKGTQAVSPAHLHEIYASLGRSIQILFSATELSITNLSKRYDYEPIMAAYFTARFAVTVRDLSHGRQALETAESLLTKEEDGFTKRCVQSYIHRCYGVFEAQSPPGCWEPALGRFSLSLTCLPSNATAWCMKGVALLEFGRFVESIEALRRALLLDLDFKAPYVNLGIALLRLGKYDDVIEISESLLLRHPESPQSNYHIGLSCFAKSQELHIKAMGLVENISPEEVENYKDLRARALQQMTLARESEEGQRLEVRFPPVSPWLEEDGEIMSMLRPERSMTAPKKVGARSWWPVTLPQNVGWRYFGWRT